MTRRRIQANNVGWQPPVVNDVGNDFHCPGFLSFPERNLSSFRAVPALRIIQDAEDSRLPAIDARYARFQLSPPPIPSPSGGQWLGTHERDEREKSGCLLPFAALNYPVGPLARW